MEFKPRQSDSRVQALSHYLWYTKEILQGRQYFMQGMGWSGLYYISLTSFLQYVGEEEKMEEEKNG